MKIPFNQPYVTGKEQHYLAEATFTGKLSGDGPFTKKCHAWLEQKTRASRALLTHSCTAALEMAALLLELEPGDEVIMPSYTFVSTANAFALRGAIPVFVDVREDTLNIDERLIESAITSRTRAIVAVHYAGVACEMEEIMLTADRYGLKVVEDAAQGVMASYRGRPLGSIGDFGAYSFHETKNVISGEGGALLVKSPEQAQRAEVLREKGTDRSRFFRGEVDKYTWQDMGSSYLPSELVAAFLWAQLEEAETITRARLALWETYHNLLADLERRGACRRPVVPVGCEHNAHMYYVLLQDGETRDRVMQELSAQNISCIFHYIPLHSSPAGQRLARAHGELSVTEDVSRRLLRLPLWVGLSLEQQERVVKSLEGVLI